MRDFSYAVKPEDETTQVFLGPLGEVDLRRVAERGCLLMDASLEAAWGGALRAFATRAIRRPADPVVLAGGEDLKTAEAAVRLWRELFARDLDRASFVIAAGGGSLLDAAGFAAATFMRGVSFVAVPTTLLAQLDAALGGKCALNVDGVKNQIGLIRQPAAIAVDLAFLDRLPEAEFRSGLGELAKSALIAGGELHALVRDRGSALRARDRSALEQAVFLALRSKAAIVARDPFDRGERAVLNAGHTAGHVIEAGSLRRGAAVPHGDAVAIGLAIEARVDPEADRESVRQVLESLALPSAMPFRIQADEARALLDRDKKRHGGLVTLPVVLGPGRVDLRNVPLAHVAAALSDEQVS